MELLTIEGNTVEKMMLQRAASVQRPINGSLEILPLCNMNCDMCYVRLSYAETEMKGGLHTADEWINLGREMQKAGVLFLLLTGGEPLLFPDFKKLYSELKQMGMVLTINTNGTLLDEEWADFFGENKPRRINITLYGADDRAYETLCHYPGGFEKTLRAIRLLKERDVDVKINGSVTKENYKDMQKIYALGEMLGVPVHMDTYMLPGIHERGMPFDEQSRLLPEEAATVGMEALKAEMDPQAFPIYVEQRITQLENGEEKYPSGITCMAGNCSFAVNWQGEMRPCVTLEEPSVPVFDTGFEAAWEIMSKESKAFRVNEKCIKCRLRPICKTCVASAWLETGSYDGVPEYLCRYAEAYQNLLYAEKNGLTRNKEVK
ncbi:MAG TPA: radical SAM protein [Candidatus Mediterraneibacter ornithocaccae]|nr:radical SAM protein [Candidatus Mediterraneibacter ornithocaccae]